MKYLIVLIFIFFNVTVILCETKDFALLCEKGYKISSIKRSNSFYQRSMAGSLTIECIKIGHNINIDTIECNPGITAPQCNGGAEGCSSNQWLGGFQAFVVENSTNAILLDPICCSSPTIKVDSLSCASERLNNVKEPFEHQIVADDLIYRGMQCWHQYDMNNTLVDLVWKMEICQYTIDTPIPPRTFNLEHCPACNCHCGIDICGDHREPIRIIHKQISPRRCSCECFCHYECI